MSNRGALFGSAATGPGSTGGNKHLVEMRAGKMNLKGHTVYPDNRKGLLYVYQSEDSLMHFCWQDRTTGVVEDDLIIFPDDCEYVKVPQCTTGRVYLLKFKSSNRRFFFWLQEPRTDKDEDNCKRINEYLNNPAGSVPSSNAADQDLQSLLNNMSQSQLMQLLGGGQMGGLSSLLGTIRNEESLASETVQQLNTGTETINSVSKMNLGISSNDSMEQTNWIIAQSGELMNNIIAEIGVTDAKKSGDDIENKMEIEQNVADKEKNIPSEFNFNEDDKTDSISSKSIQIDITNSVLNIKKKVPECVLKDAIEIILKLKENIVNQDTDTKQNIIKEIHKPPENLMGSGDQNNKNKVCDVDPLVPNFMDRGDQKIVTNVSGRYGFDVINDIKHPKKEKDTTNDVGLANEEAMEQILNIVRSANTHLEELMDSEQSIAPKISSNIQEIMEVSESAFDISTEYPIQKKIDILTTQENKSGKIEESESEEIESHSYKTITNVKERSSIIADNNKSVIEIHESKGKPPDVATDSLNTIKEYCRMVSFKETKEIQQTKNSIADLKEPLSVADVILKIEESNSSTVIAESMVSEDSKIIESVPEILKEVQASMEMGEFEEKNAQTNSACSNIQSSTVTEENQSNQTNVKLVDVSDKVQSAMMIEETQLIKPDAVVPEIVLNNIAEDTEIKSSVNVTVEESMLIEESENNVIFKKETDPRPQSSMLTEENEEIEFSANLSKTTNVIEENAEAVSSKSKLDVKENQEKQFVDIKMEEADSLLLIEESEFVDTDVINEVVKDPVILVSSNRIREDKSIRTDNADVKPSVNIIEESQVVKLSTESKESKLISESLKSSISIDKNREMKSAGVSELVESSMPFKESELISELLKSSIEVKQEMHSDKISDLTQTESEELLNSSNPIEENKEMKSVDISVAHSSMLIGESGLILESLKSTNTTGEMKLASIAEIDSPIKENELLKSLDGNENKEKLVDSSMKIEESSSIEEIREIKSEAIDSIDSLMVIEKSESLESSKLIEGKQEIKSVDISELAASSIEESKSLKYSNTNEGSKANNAAEISEALSLNIVSEEKQSFVDGSVALSDSIDTVLQSQSNYSIAETNEEIDTFSMEVDSSIVDTLDQQTDEIINTQNLHIIEANAEKKSSNTVLEQVDCSLNVAARFNRRGCNKADVIKDTVIDINTETDDRAFFADDIDEEMESTDTSIENEETIIGDQIEENAIGKVESFEEACENISVKIADAGSFVENAETIIAEDKIVDADILMDKKETIIEENSFAKELNLMEYDHNSDKITYAAKQQNFSGNDTTMKDETLESSVKNVIMPKNSAIEKDDELNKNVGINQTTSEINSLALSENEPVTQAIKETNKIALDKNKTKECLQKNIDKAVKDKNVESDETVAAKQTIPTSSKKKKIKIDDSDTKKTKSEVDQNVKTLKTKTVSEKLSESKDLTNKLKKENRFKYGIRNVDATINKIVESDLNKGNSISVEKNSKIDSVDAFLEEVQSSMQKQTTSKSIKDTDNISSESINLDKQISLTGSLRHEEDVEIIEKPIEIIEIDDTSQSPVHINKFDYTPLYDDVLKNDDVIKVTAIGNDVIELSDSDDSLSNLIDNIDGQIESFAQLKGKLQNHDDFVSFSKDPSPPTKKQVNKPYTDFDEINSDDSNFRFDIPYSSSDDDKKRIVTHESSSEDSDSDCMVVEPNTTKNVLSDFGTFLNTVIDETGFKPKIMYPSRKPWEQRNASQRSRNFNPESLVGVVDYKSKNKCIVSDESDYNQPSTSQAVVEPLNNKVKAKSVRRKEREENFLIKKSKNRKKKQNMKKRLRQEVSSSSDINNQNRGNRNDRPWNQERRQKRTYPFDMTNVSVWIPDERTAWFERLHPSDVLHNLQQCNYTLKTDKWVVVWVGENSGGQEIIYSVDPESLEVLRLLDFCPNYRNGTVRMKPCI